MATTNYKLLLQKCIYILNVYVHFLFSTNHLRNYKHSKFRATNSEKTGGVHIVYVQTLHSMLLYTLNVHITISIGPMLQIQESRFSENFFDSVIFCIKIYSVVEIIGNIEVA